jgi:phosphatidylglycerophosphatase A
MTNLYKLIAAGLGSGYLPKAPGTWGSLAYILLWALWTLILNQPATLLLGITLILGIISIAKTIQSAPAHEKKDPGYIVIDEWIGMGIALYGIESGAWINIGLAFILFRVLDALKPGPIRMVEKFPGAIGIIADDVLAGVATLFILRTLI